MVNPTSGGVWVVRVEGEADPLSSHVEATEATQAAIEHARGEDDCQIFLLDRYHRLRSVVPYRRGRVLDRV